MQIPVVYVRTLPSLFHSVPPRHYKVISFLLRHHFNATMSIVASDRCPNAVFSVQAELERHERAQNITVKRGDLFDGLKEEPGV